MKKNSVRVCVRTRPTQYFAQDNIVIDDNTIQISTSLNEEPVGYLNNKNNNFKFKFDHIFHNASQTEVYDLYARDTVQSVIEGINGAIMTYGQTGSGKTFTMSGDTQSYEHRGVAPRALSQLFGEVNSRLEFEYNVSCTYMEIYNERIFDLLTDLSNPDQASDFTIVEEADGRGTFVRGLTEVRVSNEVEALNLMFSGELARTTAQHKLNRRSNRSHSIFTVYVQRRERSGVSERVSHSKLHLVDLAGSERLKKTLDSTDGLSSNEVTRKESMCINQSLTYLEQCVVALSRRGTNHIPYRQSKLTNILKDCLGANCITVMIACIWGESSHLEETVSTLRLAQRMMKVQNEVTSVETVDTAALIKKQARIIKALKQELLMHDALHDRAGMEYEPYTPQMVRSIEEMVDRYVEAPEAEEEDVLAINTFRQMLEVCKVFKRKLKLSRQETVAAQEEAYLNATSGGGRPLSSAFGATGGEFSGESKVSIDFDPNAPTVGESDGKSRLGFSMGHAAADSRPVGGVEGIGKYTNKPKPPPSLAGSGTLGSPRNGGASPGRRGGRNATFDLPADASSGRGRSLEDMMDGSGGNSSSTLFESYISGNDGGQQAYAEFTDAKQKIKELRGKSKELAASVNEAKLRIDELQVEVDARKASRIELLRKSGLKATETEDIVDEEEFKLMKELREEKRKYKNAHEQLAKTKQSTSSAQHALDQAKARLGSGFTAWSAANAPASRPTTTGAYGDHGEAGMGELDQLDDQEAFDKMELERMLQNDPDSVAFFNAQKTRRAHMTQHGGNIKQIQRNKRFR